MRDAAAILAALVLILAAGRAAAQHWAIGDPGQGAVSLAPGAAGAHELSGLAWAGGDRWAAVSDDDHHLYWLRLDLDPGSGRIRSAAVENGVTLIGSSDLEGVVLAPDGTSATVSDEVGPAVREYALPDGPLRRTATLPPVFATARYNLGLEALARDARGYLWTANEEALRVDGPTSPHGDGTLVRLLRLDPDLRPAGQWAYRTDAVAGSPILDDRGTGLADLAALPDGRLLALERSFGTEGMRIRLYEVELDGATEVSQRPSVLGGDVVPARKRLLWERTSLRDNFEGLAIGPPLAGGARSLVLVADDGHALAQALYALTLRERAPAAAATPAP